MTLTPAQVANLRTQAGLSPTPPPVPSASSGPSSDDIIAQRKAALGMNTPVQENPAGDGAPGSTLPTDKGDALGGTLSGIANGLKSVIPNIGNALQQRGEDIVSDTQKNNKLAQDAGGGVGAHLLGAAATAGNVAGNALGGAGDIIGSAVSPFLTPALKASMADVGSKAYSGLSQIPGITPDILKKANDVFNGVMLAYGEQSAPALANKAANVASDAGEGITDAKNAITGTASDVKNAIGNKVSSLAEEGAAKDWKAPTTKSNASYSKATDIYNNALGKGHDIADTLVNNKINLSDNISEGKYSTADTAAKIRADAGKMSSDVLRPALQKADAATPLVPVKDVVDSTIRDIENSKSTTAGDMEAQIRKAKSEGEALARKYPDGMKLSDMHDEKISYSTNKYSPVGPKSDSISSNVDRAFGRTLAKSVEDNAPLDIPTHEFNQALTKQYQSADYLDSLDTKKVPTGFGTKLVRTAAKGIGSALGSSLGIGGAFAGYSLGGLLESTFEGLPVAARDALMKNLEATNPEAFSKISDYLKSPSEAVHEVIRPDTSIPKDAPVTKEMGSYKLGKNPITGIVEETGQYRKPGVNFYPKK